MNAILYSFFFWSESTNC